MVHKLSGVQRGSKIAHDDVASRHDDVCACADRGAGEAVRNCYKLGSRRHRPDWKEHVDWFSNHDCDRCCTFAQSASISSCRRRNRLLPVNDARLFIASNVLLGNGDYFWSSYESNVAAQGL